MALVISGESWGIQITGTIVHANAVTEDNDLTITPPVVADYMRLILDLNALTQTTTFRLYVQVDGANYRLLDAAIFPTDFPTNAKSIAVDLPPTSRAFRLTIQSGVLEGAVRNIPYFYVVRSLV